MNSGAKNVIRLAGVAVGIAAAAWALRHRLLPDPQVDESPPPKFREPTPESSEDVAVLTDVKGIGPVTAAKLEDAGVGTVQALAQAHADDLAEHIGSSPSTVAKWIEAADQLT